MWPCARTVAKQEPVNSQDDDGKTNYIHKMKTEYTKDNNEERDAGTDQRRKLHTGQDRLQNDEEVNRDGVGINWPPMNVTIVDRNEVIMSSVGGRHSLPDPDA